MEITPDMIKHFNTRTNYHITTVQFYAEQLISRYGTKYGPVFVDNLVTSVELHDASKYWSDERVGYILMSFKYQDEDKHSKLFDADDKKIMEDAWVHHYTNNTHHPEHYKDVNDMPIDQLAHMCADWAAVSEEVNDNIMNWYDKVIPSKYKFSPHYKSVIREFCNYLYPIITSRQVARIKTDKDGEFGEDKLEKK